GTSCPSSVDTKPFQDKNDSGVTKRTAGMVLAGVGVAALAGGLVWHFKEPSLARKGGKSARSAPGAARFEAHPEVAPGYGGLSLAGVF
ncbi:MAG TPA: hypothetical protein VNO21_03075, partial [Polyangiaceae bacterium]|nr:hypothetical protein [Polyangiaceae bacterium]